MTAPLITLFTFQEKEYSLISSVGKPIFDIKPYDIERIAINTACRRGWLDKYIIRNNILYLDKLTVSGKIDTLCEINETKPKISEEFSVVPGFALAEYDFPDFKMDFSGEIYLGGMDHGVVTTLHYNTEYDEYIKFVFSDGVCSSIEDGLRPPVKTYPHARERLKKFLEED